MASWCPQDHPPLRPGALNLVVCFLVDTALYLTCPVFCSSFLLASRTRRWCASFCREFSRGLDSTASHRNSSVRKTSFLCFWSNTLLNRPFSVVDLFEAGELKTSPEVADAFLQIMKVHRKEIPVSLTFASVSVPSSCIPLFRHVLNYAMLLIPSLPVIPYSCPTSSSWRTRLRELRSTDCL